MDQIKSKGPDPIIHNHPTNKISCLKLESRETRQSTKGFKGLLNRAQEFNQPHGKLTSILIFKHNIEIKIQKTRIWRSRGWVVPEMLTAGLYWLLWAAILDLGCRLPSIKIIRVWVNLAELCKDLLWKWSKKTFWGRLSQVLWIFKSRIWIRNQEPLCKQEKISKRRKSWRITPEWLAKCIATNHKTKEAYSKRP